MSSILELGGHRALVTGGTKGIGHAAAAATRVRNERRCRSSAPELLLVEAESSPLPNAETIPAAMRWLVMFVTHNQTGKSDFLPIILLNICCDCSGPLLARTGSGGTSAI